MRDWQKQVLNYTLFKKTYTITDAWYLTMMILIDNKILSFLLFAFWIVHMITIEKLRSKLKWVV